MSKSRRKPSKKFFRAWRKLTFTASPARGIFNARSKSRDASDHGGELQRLAGTVPSPPSVVELARALKHDVDLIFEWVYSNVDYQPMWGANKGNLGTLIDRVAGPIDQAALMVALLDESGYTASLLYGGIRLSAVEVEQLLGTDDSTVSESTENVLQASQIPFEAHYTSGNLIYVDLMHVWVSVEIDGVDYVFDPSFKTYAYTSALVDVGAAVNLNLTALRTSVMVGASSGSGYIEDFNVDNLADDFATFATNVYDEVKTTAFSANLRQAIGGRTIAPLLNTPIRQTSLPYQIPGVAPTDWGVSVPSSFKATFGVIFDSIDVEFYAPDIYGRRLTITFNSTDKAELRLDGVLEETGTTTLTPGDSYPIEFSITHPFADDTFDESWSQVIVADGTYLMANSWGPSSSSMTDYHRGILQQNMADGGADGDEDVLGESLAVFWFMRQAQATQLAALYDQLGTTQHFDYHFAGIMGYNDEVEAPYFDIAAVAFDVISRNGTSAVEDKIIAATQFVANGFEAGIMQQLLPSQGISTVQMLRAAASQKIWDATSSNWTTVSAALSNWDDYKPVIQSQVNTDSSRVIIHEDGETTLGSFVGGAWLEITDAGSILGWLQGQLTSMSMARAKAKKPVWVKYNMIQTHFSGYNGPVFPIPTCTATNLTTRRTGSGICRQDNPVSLYAITWGATGGCPNIEAEERTIPSGATFTADTSDPYPWPPNPNLWPLGQVALMGTVGKPGGSTSEPTSKPQTNGGASDSAGTPQTSDKGPGHAPCACDPISLYSGHYFYDHSDISVGSGGFPYSLTFVRQYSSADRLKDGPLGRGWSHNFETSLAIASDGLRGLGVVSPKEAAAALAHCYVLMQLNFTSFLDLLIASMSSMWLMDQLTNNAVTVNDGNDTRTYIKLPQLPSSTDPAPYSPPPGYADTLIDNEDGTFTLRSPQFLEWNFNSDGKLSTFVDPAGVTVTLGYDGSNRVTSVSNGMARTLTLAYTGERLTSVSDGNGRSVSFSVDGSANLTTYTDAEANDTVYGYASAGLLDEIFLPANPSTPFVVNEYDSLSRIKAQTPANEGESNYFFAGSRAEVVDPYGNSRVMYYNELGSLLRDIDEGGNEKIYERDGLNREIKITYPEGNSVEQEYDQNNNVLTITAIPKPGSSLANITFEFEYDNDWNKVSLAIDGEGNETSFEYDGVPGAGQGTLLKITRPEIDSQTPEIEFTYTARGQIETRTDETGIVDKFVYSGTNETLLTATRDFGTGRLNLVTEFGYNSIGDVNSITDPRGNETTFDFDNERRMTKRTECAPFGFETNFIRNENGEVITLQRQTGEVDPEFQEWNWVYNVHGDVVTTTDPAGKELNFVFDELRRLVSRTDAEGRVWQFEYDAESRVIKVTDPMGNISESRTYTDNGVLATITDARGNTTEMAHDGFDRLEVRTYPDNTTEEFTFNQNSQVLTMVTRKGDTITNTFDVLTRLKTRDPGSLATQTMAYDLAGRLLSVSTPAVVGDPSSDLFSFGHDTAGRLISQTSPTGQDPPTYRQVGYQLDQNGNRTRLTWPDSYYAEYFFDELNRLTDIKLNGSSSSAIEIAYDDLSRRTGLTYLNGCSCAYGYAINNDLTSLEHTFVGSSVTFGYSFNFVHQVTEQEVSDAEFLWKPLAISITNYAPANNLNQYPSVAGDAFSYDDNGNLTAGPFTSAAFDVINRVTQIVSGGTTNNYWNDPLNRQSQKEVDSTKTGFLYDGVQLIAEYNSGGSLVNRYIPGARLDEILVQIAGGTTTYLHQDRLGSTIAQVNTSGAVLNKYQYSPFGETPGLPGTIFGFTGQRYDAEIGLCSYKMRSYSPELGRFLQSDPAISFGNLYNYVSNDPLNALDSSGLQQAPAYVWQSMTGHQPSGPAVFRITGSNPQDLNYVGLPVFANAPQNVPSLTAHGHPSSSTLGANLFGTQGVAPEFYNNAFLAPVVLLNACYGLDAARALAVDGGMFTVGYTGPVTAYATPMWEPPMVKVFDPSGAQVEGLSFNYPLTAQDWQKIQQSADQYDWLHSPNPNAVRNYKRRCCE